MKKLINASFLILLSLNGLAQTYSSPESLEFDFANDRWLISNKSANNILARSSATGVLSIFATGISSPHGIEIANDTVYVCSGGNLVAYELSTGANVFSMSLGATYLNGITHDSTYLYITDFSAKNIYRFNMQTRAYSIFVPGVSKTPNGIIYDQANGRCVFVTWGSNAPIMAFDVTSGAVTSLTPTSLSNCDGVAIDGSGDFYVSSWGLNGISKFDHAFLSPPTTVVTGLTSPADIFYNILSDTLGVANSGSLSNTSYHFLGTSTSIGEKVIDNLEFSLNPNPVRKSAEISFVLSKPDVVQTSIFNLNGQLIQMFPAEEKSAGMQKLQFGRENLSEGFYFLKISGKNQTGILKFLILD